MTSARRRMTPGIGSESPAARAARPSLHTRLSFQYYRDILWNKSGNIILSARGLLLTQKDPRLQAGPWSTV